MSKKLTYGEFRKEFCKDGHEEFNNFQMIPENKRLHRLKDICGMMKIAEIFPYLNYKIVASAEHDMVHFDGDLSGDDDEESPLTMEDVIYLKRCGISYDSNNDNFTMFA